MRFTFSLSDDMLRLRRSCLRGLIMLVLGSQATHAVDWGADLQMHGFVTQGYVKTSANRFFGDSDEGSFEFTELGVNASFKATQSVLFSGQILSRNAGDMYDGSPTVDYALADWSFHNGDDKAYGLMIGRIKNPLGLYNETRDVAFTRPSIFLPQQVYFDAVRNLLLSADGAQAYLRLYAPYGNWMVNLGTGVTPVDENVEFVYLNNDFDGSLDADGVSFVARVGYETPDASWRLGLSAAKSRLVFDRASTAPISNGEVDILYWIASLQYNAERWSLTAEYMEEPVEFSGFGPFVPDRSATVQGYYLQGTYLIRPDLELVARYGEGFADKTDRSGRDLAALSGGMLAPHLFYQKDWTIGLRWDVTPDFMVRGEYQWSKGAGTLSRRENPNPLSIDKDWEMFSLLVSYRF